MINSLKIILDTKGLSIAEASKISKIPYVTISQHINSKRGISPALAILYEKKLGIPRSKLRPDLWAPDPAPAPVEEPADSA